MGKLLMHETQVIYMGEKGKEVILDLNDFMKNKSRIPFHTNTEDRTVDGLVESLMKN